MENSGAGELLIKTKSTERYNIFIYGFSGRKILLKPAKFQQSTKSEDTNGKSSENGNTPVSNPNNPFLKCSKEDVEPVKLEEKTEETEKNDSSSKDLFKPAKSNLFVQSSALSENSTFVFGQNLHERVVIVSQQNTNHCFNSDTNIPFLFVAGQSQFK